MSARWVSLNQLAAETGLAIRTLQYIRAQEPGVLIQRTRGKVTEYEQPACAIHLRQREVRKELEAQKPADIDEAKARKAQADAEMAEMQLAKMRHELAPVIDMDRAVEQLAGAIRAEVLGIRPRWAARLVGLETHAEAAAALDLMAAQLLAALVDRAEGLDADEPDEAAA
jgi:phage terminase Nu1 subunit (DNA packaging protein)